MRLRELGVGLVYWPELDPLFGPEGPALSVLELEPQAFWEKPRTVRAGITETTKHCWIMLHRCHKLSCCTG
jgi:hypothetical protein